MGYSFELCMNLESVCSNKMYELMFSERGVLNDHLFNILFPYCYEILNELK